MKLNFLLGVLPFIVLSISCEKKLNSKITPSFGVDELGLTLPKLPGWQVDKEAKELDPALALRLVLNQGLPGSPRIDVRVRQPTAGLNLEMLLTENLREIANLERQKHLRIESVGKQPIDLGPRRAYKVNHAYVYVANGTKVNQESLVFLLDGKGVTVTAFGRSELYAPKSEDIKNILEGIEVGTPIQRIQSQPIKHGKKKSLIRPLDLEKP